MYLAKLIKATVIIPTYNRCLSLRRVIESVSRLDFPREQFEIVVVNNNSSDDTPKVAFSFCNSGITLKYVKEERLSFTLARNTGARAASGRILCYIDDDVVVDKLWLSAVIEAFEADDRVGVVGGPIFPLFEVEPPDWIKRYYSMSGWLSLLDDGKNPHEINYAYGPNFSVRKDVFELVGGFPPDTIGVESEGRPQVIEKIYIGSGDVGLSSKVRNAKYKVVYAPEARVSHVIPPIRLTKKWWHSRFSGEGCYHAIVRQYENEEGFLRLCLRGLYSVLEAAGAALKFMISIITCRGKERYEFWISHHLTQARIEFALARRPDLARQLWEMASEGIAAQDFGKLRRLLP